MATVDRAAAPVAEDAPLPPDATPVSAATAVHCLQRTRMRLCSQMEPARGGGAHVAAPLKRECVPTVFTPAAALQMGRPAIEEGCNGGGRQLRRAAATLRGNGA
eukprot:1007428-Prymnesium_polylepis.1